MQFVTLVGDLEQCRTASSGSARRSQPIWSSRLSALSFDLQAACSRGFRGCTPKGAMLPASSTSPARAREATKRSHSSAG